MTTNQEITAMDAMDTLYAANNWKTKEENKTNYLSECIRIAAELYYVGANEGTERLLWDMEIRDDKFLDAMAYINENVKETIRICIWEVLTNENF